MYELRQRIHAKKEVPSCKEAYLISQSLEEFAAAREQFAHLVRDLQSGDTLGLEHGGAEKLISEKGNELLRRLLQGHMDLRT